MVVAGVTERVALDAELVLDVVLESDGWAVDEGCDEEDVGEDGDEEKVGEEDAVVMVVSVV